MDIYSRKNPKICRTCLQKISNSSQIFYLDPLESRTKITTTRQKLRSCVPELNFEVTPDAVICSDCLIAVDSAYNFKNKCLQTEERIDNYLRQSGSTSSHVDLMQVVQDDLVHRNIKTESFEVIEHELENPEPFFLGFKKEEIYSGKGNSCAFADLAVKHVKVEPADDESEAAHNPPRAQNNLHRPKYKQQSSNEYNAMWTETEGFYICKICDHITERKSKLVAHLRTHEIENADDNYVSPKIYAADLIDMGLAADIKEDKSDDVSSKNGANLKHFQEVPEQNDNKKLVITDGEMIYMCNECEYITERKSKLDAHSRSHKIDYTTSQGHNVPTTNTTVSKNELVHEAVHPNFKSHQDNDHLPSAPGNEMEELYMCNDCEYITERKSKLDAHSRSHKSEYTSQLRHVIKVSNNQLLNDRTDNNQDSFKPNQGGDNLASPAGNDMEELYMCNNCEYITERKSKLIVHLRTHKDNEGGVSKVNVELVRGKPNFQNARRAPYRCSTCPYGTRSKVRLDAHTKLHTGEKSYKAYCCYVCNYTTPVKKFLIVHLKIHGEDKPFKCTLCDYKANRTQSMYMHMKRHVTGKHNKMYNCYVCKYRTSLKSQLHEHLKSHDEAKAFKCPKCEYRCNRTDMLQQHFRRHLGIKPFKCAICHYKCINKNRLKLHMLRHSDDKPFKCAHCDYCSSQKQHLENHLKDHPTQSPYKCYVCDYETVFKRRLVAHLKTHGETKVFKCSQCEFRSDISKYMTLHVKTHSDDKPYKCSLCEYSTVSKSYFRTHMRIHTGEKPYECTVCNFKTTRNANLVLHMRVHTGERPYKCSICAYKARSHSALREHLKTHMGKKIYRCVMCSYKCINQKLLQGHMYVHSEVNMFKCNKCNLTYKHRGSLRIHMRKHTGFKFSCAVCDYSTVTRSHLRRHMKLLGHALDTIVK